MKEENLSEWAKGMFDMLFLIEQKEVFEEIMPYLKGKELNEGVKMYTAILKKINEVIEAFHVEDIGVFELGIQRMNVDIIGDFVKKLDDEFFIAKAEDIARKEFNKS